MIRLLHVEKGYSDGEGCRVPVLAGADLDVGAGEFLAVVGPSGCGKTTLLNLVGGLDTDYTGNVSVDGVEPKGLPDRDLARFRNRTVGFVFQSFNLMGPLTAVENVKLPSYFSDASQGDEDARARAALERVGLAAKAARRPGELSGGERQRVAIARAMFALPKILLCDEPTGNLDVRTGREIVDLFRKLNAEGLTVLVVTHEERMWSAARRVLALRDGRLVEEREGGTG